MSAPTTLAQNSLVPYYDRLVDHRDLNTEKAVPTKWDRDVRQEALKKALTSHVNKGNDPEDFEGWAKENDPFLSQAHKHALSDLLQRTRVQMPKTASTTSGQDENETRPRIGTFSFEELRIGFEGESVSWEESALMRQGEENSLSMEYQQRAIEAHNTIEMFYRTATDDEKLGIELMVEWQMLKNAKLPTSHLRQKVSTLRKRLAKAGSPVKLDSVLL